jgi:cytochrome c556
MIRHKSIVGVLAGFAVLLFSAQLFAQADAIEKRQAAMKNNSSDAKAIKAAAESKDYKTIELKAKDIMGTAEKIPSLFPKGSDKGKTKAKPEIWERSDDFSKAAKNLAKTSSELADAARAGDDAAVTAKVKAVADACGNCHKNFRAEKYSE